MGDAFVNVVTSKVFQFSNTKSFHFRDFTEKILKIHIKKITQHFKKSHTNIDKLNNYWSLIDFNSTQW